MKPEAQLSKDVRKLIGQLGDKALRDELADVP